MQIPVSALVYSRGLLEGAITKLALQAGLQTIHATNASDALELLNAYRPDVVVMTTEDASGAVRDLVSNSRQTHPGTEIILVGPPAEGLPMDSEVTSIPIKGTAGLEKLLSKFAAVARRVELEGQARPSRTDTPLRETLGSFVGKSQPIQRIYRIIEKTAHHNYPVLILGESGTGKELVARSIHEQGPRRNGPFVPVDCSALAPSLIESELFGHLKGAFTGALNSKLGLMASANGGTLFLDEIGNLPMDLQVKLLRAIQEKEIKPVGSNERIRTDARIIAATNRDLEEGIREGNFRQDLYFRLNVVQIRIPPLCNRREDIPLLAKHFFSKLSVNGTRVRAISDEAMERLKGYDWPGNVRELENAIERGLALSSGPILHVGDLPTNLQYFSKTDALRSDEIVPLEELERRAIYRAIREAGGDKLAAARLLGIGKTTLYRKLKEYEKKALSKPKD